MACTVEAKLGGVDSSRLSSDCEAGWQGHFISFGGDEADSALGDGGCGWFVGIGRSRAWIWVRCGVRGSGRICGVIGNFGGFIDLGSFGEVGGFGRTVGVGGVEHDARRRTRPC